MGGWLNWETFLAEANIFCFIHVGDVIQRNVFLLGKKENPSWELQKHFFCTLRYVLLLKPSSVSRESRLANLENICIRSNFCQAQSRHFPYRNHTLTGLGYMWGYSSALPTPLPPRPRQKKSNCLNRCPKHEKFRYQCRFEIGTFVIVYLHLNSVQFFKICTVWWRKKWVKVPS